MKYEELLFY